LIVMSVTTHPIAAPAPLAFWRLQGFPLISTLILLLIAFVAIFADVLAPHDPQIGNLARRFRPPAWQEGGSMTYLLGTDHVGRDVLSRLMFGARVSMIVGLAAVLVAGSLGTLRACPGCLAGWTRIMR
jgi:peptide/nickel transport system permease protein